MTRPTPEQIEATDPRVSCWVTANAGSGKTHVLTQRVARLLLAGCEPQKILCLTYTKAAAAEMQTRLFRLLGDWTMASTEDLRSGLAALSGSEAPAASEAQLSRARQLFARALESPGGLKIQTIHAFCDSLLRRFPLEASISPQFNVTDDRDRETLVAGVRAVMAEAAADGRDPAFDKAADLLTEDGIDQLTAGVLGNRSRLDADGLEDRLAGHFGSVVADTETAICKRALARLNWDQYAALSDVLLTKGGKQDQSLGAVLALPAAQREADPSGAVDALVSRMLTSSFRARATERFPVKNVKSAYPAAADEIAALSAWALETRDLILSRRTAQRTRDLYGFSGGLLDRYAAAKHNRGLMDFDDLVSRARALLVDRAMRGWVLYKLDEGIDHILVDEAQDTAPLQWDVIKAISDEFLSGDGAARGPRTIFVVGDEKQSIYSFQGADPGAFAGVRDIYRRRLSDLGDRLVRPLLRTSFRSAPAILEFVDAVFDGPLAACLTTDPEGVGHHAHRNGERGRVDLWPLLAKPEAAEPPPWWEPVDTVPLSDPRQKLAETLAGEISAMIGTATLPARAGRPARFVRPGDILVLVARRNPWTAVIIRHLKALGVPVSGADRLRLSDALSVKDLLALLRFVTLPDDDLSLAAVLRSPLGGISEEALFQLAHGRGGTLHAALRQSPEHTELRKMIDDLSREADFLRPYEMLERILVRHRGRHKLLARLGTEAEDPIDELLAQALVYERNRTPSLTGFVDWIETGDIMIKREMESGSDEVRVMTVHGSKGLEAPIVIVPDTTGAPLPGRGPHLVPAVPSGNRPDLMLWLAGKSAHQDDPVARSARAAAETRQSDERSRLLYVALTRAEDWLILCGAEPGRSADGTWYEALANGMDKVASRNGSAVTYVPSPTGDGEMRRFQTGPEPSVAAEMPAGGGPGPDVSAPAWLTAAPVEPVIERKSPSGLTGSDVLLGGAGLGADAARNKGIAIHTLLEHLAPDPASVREQGPALLSARHPEIEDQIAAMAIEEACNALGRPDIAALFGPDTLMELPICVDPPGGGLRMIGRIDMLVLSGRTACVVDIKSDARPPLDPQGIPQKYLAQLGAYASAVHRAWSDRDVRLAIVWTAAPALMDVPLSLAHNAFETANWDARQTAKL